MPTLPWIPGPAKPQLSSEAVVMASRFELTTFRQVPAFVAAALRVYRQVRRSEGAVGVTLIAHPMRREFFTLSSWRDREAIDAMVRSEPHLSVMNGFREYTSAASFAFWTIPATTRPTWKEAHQRLAEQSQ